MSNGMSNTNGEKLWDEKNSIEPMKNNASSQTNAECDITTNINVLKDSEHLKDITKEKICGIYKIVNKINRKYYVGSSTNIMTGSGGRWNRHKRSLYKNTHHNDYLQRAWNKYGPDVFEIIIIESVQVENLKIREQYYLDIAKLETDKCYNLNFDANGKNVRQYSINKNTQSQLLYYDHNPSARFDRTRHLHTKSVTEQRKNSLKEFYKNNPEIAKSRGLAVKNYYLNNPTKKLELSKKLQNPTVFRFQNTVTNEIFIGTQSEFKTTYNLLKGSVNNLIKLRNKSLLGWVLLP